jgi:hypothetical protein
MLGPIVVGIQGDDKTGKSTLALSFPTPIRHFDLDVGGFRRARNRYEEAISAGVISSKSYYMPQQGIRSKLLGKAPSFKDAARIVGMKELWYEMVEDYLDALEAPEGSAGFCRTIVLDSFPQDWELCRLAFLQEKQEAQLAKDPTVKYLRESLIQIEYTEPNARMRAQIYGARQFGKNLVLTHQLAPVFGKVLQDGKMVDAVVGQKNSGWSHIGKEVDLMLQTSIKSSRGPGGSKVSTPVVEVLLSGLGLEIVGMEIEQPSYEKLANLVEMMRG